VVLWACVCLFAAVVAPKEVDADPLQLIHAYHNLAKTLDKLIQTSMSSSNNTSISMSEENEATILALQNEMNECVAKENELKQKYLERYNNKVLTETHNFRTIVKNVEEIKSNLNRRKNVWWMIVLDHIQADSKLVCIVRVSHTSLSHNIMIQERERRE
jgi:hypothetical protein